MAAIPQDAFQVKEGTLHESLLTVSAPPDVDADDPKALEKLIFGCPAGTPMCCSAVIAV